MNLQQRRKVMNALVNSQFGCSPLVWMLPPCMDAAPLYGCCPLVWTLPPCMDVAPLYGRCPLVWMLHSRKLNTRINRIHERALRVVYNDMVSSFDELLLRNNSVYIRNILAS